MSHTTEDKKLEPTTGPWFWGGNYLMGAHGEFASTHILELNPDSVINPSSADKSLIASSRDLYNALKSLYEAREMGGTSVMDWEILFDTAKLALDKAIGK